MGAGSAYIRENYFLGKRVPVPPSYAGGNPLALPLISLLKAHILEAILQVLWSSHVGEGNFALSPGILTL